MTPDKSAAVDANYDMLNCSLIEDVVSLFYSICSSFSHGTILVSFNVKDT